MAASRKKRTPVGGSQQKRRLPIVDKRDRLWFPQDPTMKRVIVTTKLLKDYLDSGFTHVKWSHIGQTGEGAFEEGSKMGEYVSWNVGRADGQENAIGWLVEMPMQMWENDVKPQIEEERNAPIQEIHRQIKKAKRKSGFYGQGVKMELGDEEDLDDYEEDEE